MKIDTLKKILKEVVKEVVQDELKDILLEALKSPKQTPMYTPPINEGIKYTTHQPTATQPVNGTPVETTQTAGQTPMEKYMSILNETASPAKPGSFTPNPGAALGQGSLGEGELDINQIASLMKG